MGRILRRETGTRLSLKVTFLVTRWQGDCPNLLPKALKQGGDPY